MRRSGRRVVVGAGAALALLLAPWAVMAAPASGDVPTTPVTEFYAELCEGTTESDPRIAEGAVPDLTRVWGARLADYNAGQVVALYDAFGENNNNGYPPVCSVRYVEGVGPVSEWMFCTDIWSHVCSGVDELGNLLDFDGVPVPGLEPRPDGNPRLDRDQEKLIAYLVRNGAPYAGTNYYEFGGVSEARVDAGTLERIALQVLVWCVSDPPEQDHDQDIEQDRYATCQDSMDEDEQERLLGLIPDVPVVELELDALVSEVEVGGQAVVEVTTNVFDAPIELELTGAAGLAVLAGDAMVTPEGLRVAGDGTGTAVTVRLGVTLTDVGSAELRATAYPTSTESLSWNQSPGITASDDVPCQVFATFSASSLPAVREQVSLLALSDPEPEETPDPGPTPEPEETPDPEPTPQPDETPDPEPENTPEPEPSPDPQETPEQEEPGDEGRDELPSDEELATTGGAPDGRAVGAVALALVAGGALVLAGRELGRPVRR